MWGPTSLEALQFGDPLVLGLPGVETPTPQVATIEIICKSLAPPEPLQSQLKGSACACCVQWKYG